MERITSRTNETVKAVVRLRERAERARRRLFFCEGVHLAEEFLRHGRPVERVFATDAALESHGALLAGFGDRVTLVTPEVYGKLSEEKAPQGILLVAPWPENVSGRKPSAKRRSILLDGVRDPGNVGTVIRTAAALGIGRVVLSRDCADVLACKTVRASMGAVLCTDILLAPTIWRPRSAPLPLLAARSLPRCFPRGRLTSLPAGCRRIFLSSSATRGRACVRTSPRPAPAACAYRRPTVPKASTPPWPPRFLCGR